MHTMYTNVWCSNLAPIITSRQQHSRRLRFFIANSLSLKLNRSCIAFNVNQLEELKEKQKLNSKRYVSTL